jgi:hypothetical protein
VSGTSKTTNVQLAALALLIQAVLVLGAASAVGVVADLAQRWDDATFNERVRRAAMISYGVAAVGALWMPGAIIRRWPRAWSADVVRLAHFVGPSTLVGSCVGLFAAGRAAHAVAESIIGKIEHNSLWAFPCLASRFSGRPWAAFLRQAGLRIWARGAAVASPNKRMQLTRRGPLVGVARFARQSSLSRASQLIRGVGPALDA